MSPVAFLDLGALHRELREEMHAALERALESGRVIGGEEVEAFEREWAEYCEARFCIGVSNGTDAIEVGLRAAGIGPGDEVIIPALTFVATAEAVIAAGATPVLADVDPRTALMDPQAAAAAITPRTAAILPVHLWGQPADLDALGALAAKRGLLLAEDAAQAHGARWQGRRIGGQSAFAAFSMYPGKNLGALGDAGALTTNDEQLASAARTLIDHGRVSKQEHGMVGMNGRLDALQAAFLRIKLRRLDEWNERRRAHADAYRAAFSGSDVEMFAVAEQAEHVYHHFVIRLGDQRERDALGAHLDQRGIGWGIHYARAIHQNPAFADLERPGALPIAEALPGQILSLPVGPTMSPVERECVIEAVLDFHA